MAGQFRLAAGKGLFIGSQRLGDRADQPVEAGEELLPPGAAGDRETVVVTVELAARPKELQLKPSRAAVAHHRRRQSKARWFVDDLEGAVIKTLPSVREQGSEALVLPAAWVKRDRRPAIGETHNEIVPPHVAGTDLVGADRRDRRPEFRDRVMSPIDGLAQEPRAFGKAPLCFLQMRRFITQGIKLAGGIEKGKLIAARRAARTPPCRHEWRPSLTIAAGKDLQVGVGVPRRLFIERVFLEGAEPVGFLGINLDDHAGDRCIIHALGNDRVPTG